MWPFDKKFKIVFEDTAAAIKKREDAAILAKQKEDERKLKRDANRKIMWEVLDQLIKGEVANYKMNCPQPFKVGDDVCAEYYSYFGESVGGWLSTTRVFIQTFEKTHKDVTPRIKLKVAKIWVDTGWITERFSKYNSAEEEIINLNNEIAVRNVTCDIFFKLKDIHKNVVEWAFDCNWEDMNLTNEEGKVLDLKWGGFPCSSAALYDSEYAKAQRDLFDASEALRIAQVNFKKQEAAFQADIASLKDKSKV